MGTKNPSKCPSGICQTLSYISSEQSRGRGGSWRAERCGGRGRDAAASFCRCRLAVCGAWSLERIGGLLRHVRWDPWRGSWRRDRCRRCGRHHKTQFQHSGERQRSNGRYHIFPGCHQLLGLCGIQGWRCGPRLPERPAPYISLAGSYSDSKRPWRASIL